MMLKAKRRRLRAEPGIRGYRGIIVVITLIGLVAVLAFTGIFRRGLCILDSASCPRNMSSVPTAKNLDPGELPAPTDERAVSNGAGVGTVPPGLRTLARGKTSVVAGDPPPSQNDLWGDPRHAGSDNKSPWESPVFLHMDKAPCGTESTAPCDTFPELRTDSTAEQTQGAQRLSLLGLDPYLGEEGATNVVDLTLPSEKSIQFRKDANGDNILLYRNSQRLRDGLTTETWTWQKTESGSTDQLKIERTREGVLHSFTAFRVTQSSGRLKVTTVSMPVLESTKDALDELTSSLMSAKLELPDSVFNPVTPASMSDEMVVRLAKKVGQVIRETRNPGAGFGGLTLESLRNDPGLVGSTTPVSKETLSSPDKTGKRAFTSESG